MEELSGTECVKVKLTAVRSLKLGWGKEMARMRELCNKRQGNPFENLRAGKIWRNFTWRGSLGFFEQFDKWKLTFDFGWWQGVHELILYGQDLHFHHFWSWIMFEKLNLQFFLLHSTRKTFFWLFLLKNHFWVPFDGKFHCFFVSFEA